MLRSVSVLAIILAFCMVVPPWHWPEYIASFLWRGIYVTSVIVAVAAGMFLLMLNVIIFMTDGTRRGAFILIAVSLFAIALGSTVARCVYPLAVAEGEQDDSQDHQERKTSK